MPPTRREAISLFGLGAGTPSRFPYAGRPQPAPAVGPGQGQPVRARQVIISGTGTGVGVFVYVGTPGLGNPPREWMTSGTVDPFGNVLPVSGTGTSAPTQGWSALLNSLIYIGANGDTTAKAATLAAPASGEVQLTGNLQTLADVPAIITLLSAAFLGTATGLVEVGTVAQGCGLLVRGGATVSTGGTFADPSVITTDTWHQVGAYINGWSGNANLDYRLAADDTIEINGRITNVAGTAGNSQVTTLTGYAPANRTEFAVGIDTNGNTHSLQLDTAGRFQVNTAVAAGGTVTVAVRIPRSAPA